jgi:dodecin
MGVGKVVELTGQSPESWEAATQLVLDEAAKTIRNIQSIYIREMLAEVENNKITAYRVHAKVTFLVDDQSARG